MRLSVVSFVLTTLLVGSTALSLNRKSSSSKASVPNARSRALQGDCAGAANAFASCLEANGVYNADGQGNRDFNCIECDASKDWFYSSCGGASNSLLMAVARLFELGVPNPSAALPAAISRSVVNTVFDGVGSCPADHVSSFSCALANATESWSSWTSCSYPGDPACCAPLPAVIEACVGTEQLENDDGFFDRLNRTFPAQYGCPLFGYSVCFPASQRVAECVKNPAGSDCCDAREAADMFCSGVPAPQHYYGGNFATYDEVRAFTASCRNNNNNNNNNTNYDYVRCDYNARIPDLFAGAPNAAGERTIYTTNPAYATVAVPVATDGYGRPVYEADAAPAGAVPTDRRCFTSSQGPYQR